jgi:hypothetical protein
MAPDVLETYRNRTRVALRPGWVRLPRTTGPFTAELIDFMEVGPDRTRYVPAGPGAVTLVTWEGSEPGQLLFGYNYLQTLSAAGGASSRQVDAWFEFETRDGQAPAPLVVVDEGWLTTTGRRWLGWGSCEYTLYDHHLIQAPLANGDRVELHTVGRVDPVECMHRCEADLVGAAFEKGGERREVTDRFRVAYCDWQHNSFPQYLAVFDSPLAGVHALRLYGAGPPTAVDFLDGSFAVIETVPIASWTGTPE